MSAKATRRALLAAGLVLAVLALAACAAGANSAVDTPAADGDVAGLWMGLWHGLILPITFVVSLFTESVSVYEVHNSGGWYDAGFVLGAACSLGGSGAGAKGAKS